MEIIRRSGGFARTKMRSAGHHRKFKFTKSLMPQLVEIVREEGKKRIRFTDTMMPGLKAVVSETGGIVFYHQWTPRARAKSKKEKKKKRFDKLADWPGLSPEKGRELVQVRTERIAFGLDPSVPDLEMPTMREFIEGELEWLLGRYKRPKTIESQIRCWFLEYFKGDLDKPLNQYTRKDLIKFYGWVKLKRSAETANRCKSTAQILMTQAVDLGYIERNPCHGIKKFVEADSRSEILSDGEYAPCAKAVIRNIDHLHSKILYLLLLIPLRFMEVAAMQWSQIDLEKGAYFIPADLSKNRRARTIALNQPTIDLLTEMSSQRDKSVDWVFPAKSKSGHVVDIRVQFKKILEEAGIDKKSFRVHDIRRTGASALLNDYDANPLKIMEILGHRDMRSTMVYARLSAKSMAETSDLLGHKFTQAVSE